jgi:superfamily II DNA/RNA helicase
MASAATPAPDLTSFQGLGLPERLVDGLLRRGITAPSPIQTRTLPDALAGRDVLGRAQTGSGKTLAFGLPVLALLAGGADGVTGRAVPLRPNALVLVPTRELAEQVKEAIAPLGNPLGVKVTAVYGGASMQRQREALRRGAHVIVATPGRLEDLIRQGACMLDNIGITVLDEADYMADLGFMPAVTRLLDQVPTGTQRMLFSATLDRGVDALVHRYLHEPALHAVAAAVARVETMDHLAFTVSADDKVAVAAEIAARPGRTLFFVRTKHGADRLALKITQMGVEAGAIHGNLRQAQRQKALDAFSSGHVRVLVATDVAARGIHVDNVDLVVHFDPPADHKDYLHRSGRTARAGSRGTVLSLLLPDEVRGSRRLHEHLGTEVTPVDVFTGHEAVRAVAASGTPFVPAPRAVAPAGARNRPPRPASGRDGDRRYGAATPYRGRPRRVGAGDSA